MLFISLSLGLIASFFLTPLIINITSSYDLLDYPKQRGINQVPIPSLGGIAIYLSFLLILLIQGMLAKYPGIILGASILVILGVVDDLLELKASHKLLGQLLACLLPIFLAEIEINLFFGHKIVAGVIILLWLLYLINSINFLDGLDGLASGVTIILAIALASLAYLNQQQSAFLFSLALITALLGFLPYNYKPATIFMGDTGSMLLGFILGVTALKSVVEINIITVFILLIIFIIPIIDTLIVFIKRYLAGNSIFKADKNHFHHRLLKLGYEQKEVNLIIYLLNTFFIIYALAFYLADFKQFVFLFLTFLIYLGLGIYQNKLLAL